MVGVIDNVVDEHAGLAYAEPASCSVTAEPMPPAPTTPPRNAPSKRWPSVPKREHGGRRSRPADRPVDRERATTARHAPRRAGGQCVAHRSQPRTDTREAGLRGRTANDHCAVTGRSPCCGVVGEQPIDLVIKCGSGGIARVGWMKMGRPLSRNARPKGRNKAGRRDVEPARSSLSVRSGRNVVKLSTRQSSPDGLARHEHPSCLIETVEPGHDPAASRPLMASVVTPRGPRDQLRAARRGVRARRRALVETALVCADGCGEIWLAFLVLRLRSCTDGDCRKAVA